ncbi:MAG: preprotein translocase subunit SecE [Clostridia bacterium]|nr:preprotein translocase subunit SecE [Clostridia bacterium]
MSESKEIKNTKSAPAKRKGFKGLGGRIAKTFREYKSEFKKIVWPTPKQVVMNTVATLVFCAIVGIFIAVVDWLLGLGLSLVVSA